MTSIASTFRRAQVGGVLVVLLALAGCGEGEANRSGDSALIVVSAPVTAQPWVGQFMRRGAELAAAEVNAGNGRAVRIEVLDNGGSAQQAAANARTALERGAVALITDGVGTEAIAAVTDPARLPVFVVFEGGASLVSAQQRPSVFRMAPANKAMCRRLADYLADTQRGKSVALMSDDSTYGREGGPNVKADLLHNDVKVLSDQVLPEGAADVSAQVRTARRSGAEVLVVWARPAVLAAVVRAARSAGWDAPIYAGPTAEDPLVRQRLADRPEWVENLVFVSFRITSEVGSAPFATYRKAYEKRFGVDRIGVRSGGREVVMPPDWSMYPYDTVKLLAAALDRAQSSDQRKVFDALLQTTVTGANGDDRGFGPTDREGVSPDDMYFATFRGMRFYPKKDDILSTNLPDVPQ